MCYEVWKSPGSGCGDASSHLVRGSNCLVNRVLCCYEAPASRPLEQRGAASMLRCPGAEGAESRPKLRAVRGQRPFRLPC